MLGPLSIEIDITGTGSALDAKEGSEQPACSFRDYPLTQAGGALPLELQKAAKRGG